MICSFARPSIEHPASSPSISIHSKVAWFMQEVHESIIVIRKGAFKCFGTYRSLAKPKLREACGFWVHVRCSTRGYVLHAQSWTSDPGQVGRLLIGRVLEGRARVALTERMAKRTLQRALVEPSLSSAVLHSRRLLQIAYAVIWCIGRWDDAGADPHNWREPSDDLRA